MSGGSDKKRPCSARDDRSSDEPVKTHSRDGIDRTRAGPSLTSSGLSGIRIPRRDMTGSVFHDGADVQVYRRYAGVEFSSSADVG